MIPSSALIARQAKLAAALKQAGLPALVLNPGSSLTYLTGMHFHLSERPVLALFFPERAPIMVLPELETAKLDGLAYPLSAFPYGEDPSTWAGVVHQALLKAEIQSGQVGVEPRCLRVLELRLLESAAPGVAFDSAEELLAGLRICKDAAELAAMRRAAQIAQQALRATLPAIHAGAMESEIAAELTLQLLRAGSDSEMPFTPIISTGPNSANPHAFPSERKLAQGDLLVVDWGAAYQGYFSDITRTFAIGAVEAEFSQIAAIVEQANAAGRAIARPGISAGEVDQAARSVIEAAGYGRYFTHRTGHGLGMESHEAPYLRAGNPQILQPGMTFTIEPGIYLPGRGGVRIEDDMVITANGAESLSDYPRGLQVVE